jgi:hypothetical protein
MSKHVLRALGLSLLAALGLMAFAAAGAQAANLTAPWTHSKIIILGKEKLEASVTGEADGKGTLLVPGLGIEITCDSFDVTGGLVNFTSEEGHGEGLVLFLKCLVYAIEKTLPFKLTSETPLPCLPLDVKNGEDGSIHAEALFLVVLHEGLNYLIAEQVKLIETLPLSEIVFSPGTGCPIPLKPKVFGSVPFLIEKGDLVHNQEDVIVLIKGDGHSLPPLFGTKLLYGAATEAYLDGSASLKLIGAHLGCKWGVI